MRQAFLGMCIAACCVCGQTPRGWTQGKGFGWVYGNTDEVGSLNGINSPSAILRALRDVKTGRVFDLGVRVDRTSYKWPGHSPTEIVSFRSPGGLAATKDIEGFAAGERNLGFHSCAMFISDNVGTQVDGLGHITAGTDNHWYNGFRERENASDFGVLKADADTIPPIIGRAILIDVAAWEGVEALPSNFPIAVPELQAALKAQKMDVQPGDIVLIRTGTLRHWGETGANHAKIGEHDSAGLTLSGAKWLVEQKGAVFIGSDTSGLEVRKNPEPPGLADTVHEYLLIQQGVHIGEFHNLEELAENKVYRFTYIAMTNRLRGTVAGTAMRPIAIQ